MSWISNDNMTSFTFFETTQNFIIYVFDTRFECWRLKLNNTTKKTLVETNIFAAGS